MVLSNPYSWGAAKPSYLSPWSIPDRCAILLDYRACPLEAIMTRRSQILEMLTVAHNRLGSDRDTRLHIGPLAVVQVTGLRNPCAQMDKFQKGLLSAVLEHDEQGKLIRKAGIMGIVLMGGNVKPGDEIRLELPPEPHLALERV